MGGILSNPINMPPRTEGFSRLVQGMMGISYSPRTPLETLGWLSKNEPRLIDKGANQLDSKESPIATATPVS